MKKLLLIFSVLALLVVAGCSKPLAGQAVNLGGKSGGGVAGYSNEGCVQGKWWYQDGAGKAQGPFEGCTEYDSAGQPWCATNTVSINTRSNQQAYITNNGQGTARKYCEKEQTKLGYPTKSHITEEAPIAVATCPAGYSCTDPNQPITGKVGDAPVCGTDLNWYTCTTNGWSATGEKCDCPTQAKTSEGNKVSNFDIGACQNQCQFNKNDCVDNDEYGCDENYNICTQNCDQQAKEPVQSSNVLITTDEQNAQKTVQFAGNCGYIKTVAPISEDLAEYPATFTTDGTFNGFFVVGEKALATDNLAAITIMAKISDNEVVVKDGTSKLDSEIQTFLYQNMIIVGNACGNDVALQLLHPDCKVSCSGESYTIDESIKAGTARIKLVQTPKGGKILFVYGHTPEDTRLAAKVLAYRTNELKGNEVEIVGTLAEWNTAKTIPIN